MADIRLDFGVDKGVSKINIEKDLTDIVNQLPTFGIKVGVNAESLQEFKAQLESTKEQINGLKDFQLNLGGANVAIQTAGELDATIKDILTQLKSLNTIPIGFTDEVISFSTAFSNIYTDINSITMLLRSLNSAIKGVGAGEIISISTLLDNIENAILTIDDTIKDMGRIKLDSSIKSQFEGLVNSITLIENSLQSVRTFTLPQGLTNNINDILVQLRSVNQAITDIWISFAEFGTLDSAGQQMISLTEQFIKLNNGIHSVTDAISGLKANLTAAFSDGDQGLVNFDIELNRIRDTIKNNKTEVYTGTSWFGYDEAKRLEVMNADLGTLTEQLSQISKILMQISTLVDTISKKEFSITNTFTGNLENFKDKAQETRLYRDRLLELYKVVRDYNSEAERMASTRYVNGEVNRLFQQIPGTGISNIFEMLNQLDELGVSERSIYSMSNMKSIEAKMGRLNELKSIYETLFQEVQKYQQAESKSALAKTGFEIKMPDTSGFQKANEALDKYLNKITEIKTAAADAAMQQVSSKQTTERLETAKQMAAIVEQSLATPQQQLSELQTKITETFDLSKITPNTEKITQTLSGVKQQLTEIQAQIRSTFDLSAIPFDTTKITSGVAGIKNQLSEIQVQVNGIFDPSKMIFDPKSIEQIAAATKNAFDLSGANLDSSKFTRFTAEITQQLTRIQNQLRTTFNTANLVIDTAKVDDFLRHVSGELVRIQNQLRETFNGARLVVDTAKVGDFTTEVKRQIAEVKAEIATIFDLSGVTFDYTQFDAFTGRIKSGFDEIRTSVKSSLDGIKAYINEVTGAYANLLVQIDKAANNPVVQKVAETTTSTATTQPGGTEANQQAAISVRELATAHKELAQAMAGSTAANKASRTSAEQQAMSMKTKLSIAQALFMTERQLSQLLTANAHDESAEYLQLADAFDILSMAADRVRENVHDVEYIFKEQFGKTADYLTRVRTEMLAYQAQVEKLSTGGHITDSQFYGAISSMKNIQALYPDKAGLAIYDQIIERLRLFMEAEADVKSGLTSIDEALNYVGLEGKTVIQDTVDMMKEFNAQVTGETPVLKLHEQITSLSGAIKTARESGKDVLNTEQFKNVNIVMDQLKNALNQVETENKSVNQAFADLGTTAKQSFDKAKIAISDLKTLLNETAKPTKEGAVKIFDASALEKSIAKMQGLANQALREPNAKKTKEYLDLANHLNLANQAFEALKQNELTAEQALAQYGTNGTEYVRDLTTVVDAFNIVLKKTANETIKSNNAAKAQAQAAREAEAEQKRLNQTQAEALANAKRLKEAYLQVLRMQSSMVTSLNSASNRNSALIGSNEYQAVQNYLNQFKSATAAMASENLNIFDAFTSIGGNFENAVLRANEAMAQLKIVTGETAKEAKDAEAKVTSLAKAYDALARANRLINNNQNLKNTAEYTSLVRNRDEMQHIVDLLENGVKTVGGYRQQYTSLDDVFQQLNVDGEQLFENLRVSASRFNNEIAKTEKSITLDAAYKKLGSLQNLLNSKKGKTLIGTDEYNAVLDSVNQLATAIAKAESQQISMNQAFEQMGVTSKDALGQMNLAAEKMKILLDSTQVTDMKTAWQEVQSATRLLNNNQSMAGDTTYQKLKSDVELMAKAIEEARKNNTTLDVQLQQLGRDGKQALDNIRLGALDLKAAMDGVGVSGTTTEVKLERAMNSLKKLQTDADKYQGYSFNLNGSPAVIEQTEQYTKLQAQIQTVARALELMRNSGLSADEALVQLGTTGTELFSNIELNSVRMKGAIDQVTRAYKEATSGAKANNQEEKNRQNLIAKAYSLMSKSQKITTNWTMAATGKSASSYRDIQGYANALGNLISQFKAGSISSADFSRQIATIDAGLKQGITTIQAAGENAASLSLRLNNIAQRFGAWFGATRIIMRVITSLKQMISTSIELDDAFTQLQVVTKDTDATYERFGSTVARIAKETAVSMKDITDAATTFARLGYNLDEAAKLAEYTAKLQNVGDIETQEAQDAITSILKAYDEVDADHIEEVMNKLITTGKYNCPTVW